MSDVLTLLGFARKSGNLLMGETLCEQGLSTKKVSLVLIATDMNEKTKNKFKEICDRQSVPYRELLSKEQMSGAVGKSNYGLVGIANKKFSRALIERIDA